MSAWPLGTGQKEFSVLDIPKRERGTRTDETIELLRLAWQGEPFSYAGRHFQFSDVIVTPPPAQQPGPPIWIGGSSLAAARRAAGTGWRSCRTPGPGPRCTRPITRACRPGSLPGSRRTGVLFAAQSTEKAWELCGEYLLYQFNGYRKWFSNAGDDDSHGAVR